MYYGSHKISEIKDIEQNGVEYKLVFFEPETDEEGNTKHIPHDITSSKVLEAIQTEEQKDADFMYNQKMKVIRDDILSVLVYHNLYANEWELLKAMLDRNLADTFEQADDIARGEPSYRRSLHLCNKIQLEAQANKEEE